MNRWKLMPVMNEDSSSDWDLPNGRTHDDVDDGDNIFVF